MENARQIGKQFRSQANEMEQEAARLKAEARRFRAAAYELAPVGRRPKRTRSPGPPGP